MIETISSSPDDWSVSDTCKWLEQNNLSLAIPAFEGSIIKTVDLRVKKL